MEMSEARGHYNNREPKIDKKIKMADLYIKKLLTNRLKEIAEQKQISSSLLLEQIVSYFIRIRKEKAKK